MEYLGFYKLIEHGTDSGRNELGSFFLLAMGAVHLIQTISAFWSVQGPSVP